MGDDVRIHNLLGHLRAAQLGAQARIRDAEVAANEARLDIPILGTDGWSPATHIERAEKALECDVQVVTARAAVSSLWGARVNQLLIHAQSPRSLLCAHLNVSELPAPLREALESWVKVASLELLARIHSGESWAMLFSGEGCASPDELKAELERTEDRVSMELSRAFSGLRLKEIVAVRLGLKALPFSLERILGPDPK